MLITECITILFLFEHVNSNAHSLHPASGLRIPPEVVSEEPEPAAEEPAQEEPAQEPAAQEPNAEEEPVAEG